MSISQKIEDLITASNAVTGESRTDLTSCIQDLKDGYGEGGGQSDLLTTKIRNNYGRFWFTQKSMNVIQYCHFMVEDTSLNFNSPNNWRIICKFKINTTPSLNTYKYLFGSNVGTNVFYIPNIYIHTNSNAKLHAGGDWTTNGSSWSSAGLYLSTELSLNTWYYIVKSYDKATTTHAMCLYDENGTLIERKSATTNAWFSSNADVCFGGQGLTAMFSEGEISPMECLIELDGTAIFGMVNSKTQNMGFETI